MADLKRTRRAREVVEQVSLEDVVSKRRCLLVKDRENVPNLRKKIRHLTDTSMTLTKRYQFRDRHACMERVRMLQREIDVLISMRREHDFERTVVTYLRTYHSSDAAAKEPSCSHNETIKAFSRENDRVTQHRSVIMDEYLSEIDQAPPKVAMATRDECPRCGIKLLLCGSRSIMSCSLCGYSVTYLDATSTSTSFDEVVEYSQYSYKRVNHYMMWLALVQGKEAHSVPDDILQSISEDLYERQHVRASADVTQKRVREALRKHRLKKGYDHVAQITARISGVRAPRITAGTEEQLKNMFLQMQPAFQRHSPKTRTNFLSYSYVLYRCFQILGLHHMLKGLTLLKGRDKLEANDAIFRRMSEDLGWPIFELPPVVETV